MIKMMKASGYYEIKGSEGSRFVFGRKRRNDRTGLGKQIEVFNEDSGA
jgi:hypothetical protein